MWKFVFSFGELYNYYCFVDEENLELILCDSLYAKTFVTSTKVIDWNYDEHFVVKVGTPIGKNDLKSIKRFDDEVHIYRRYKIVHLSLHMKHVHLVYQSEHLQAKYHIEFVETQVDKNTNEKELSDFLCKLDLVARKEYLPFIIFESNYGDMNLTDFNSYVSEIVLDLQNICYLLDMPIFSLSDFMPYDAKDTTIDLSSIELSNLLICPDLFYSIDAKRLNFFKVDLSKLLTLYRVIGTGKVNILDFSSCYNDISGNLEQVDLDLSLSKQNIVIAIPSGANNFKDCLLRDNHKLQYKGSITKNSLESFYARYVLLGKEGKYLVEVV